VVAIDIDPERNFVRAAKDAFCKKGHTKTELQQDLKFLSRNIEPEELPKPVGFFIDAIDVFSYLVGRRVPPYTIVK
jgi:hypothetical protein